MKPFGFGGLECLGVYTHNCCDWVYRITGMEMLTIVSEAGCRKFGTAFLVVSSALYLPVCTLQIGTGYLKESLKSPVYHINLLG